MDLLINGAEENIELSIHSLALLLQHLQIESDTVVVDINGEIFNKEQFNNTDIKNGDVIEIIDFIGGG